MNYHHKTISLHGAASKKYAIIFSERSFSWGTKCFAQKIYGGGGYSREEGRANDPILPR